MRARSAAEKPPSGPIRMAQAPPAAPPSAWVTGAASPPSSQNISRRFAAPGRQQAPEVLGLENLRDVHPPRLFGAFHRDGGEAGDVGAIGVGALGDHRPHAARAQLGRLLDDGLQPRALDQGDDEVEVGPARLRPRARFDEESATAACPCSTTRARHSPSRPLNSSTSSPTPRRMTPRRKWAWPRVGHDPRIGLQVIGYEKSDHIGSPHRLCSQPWPRRRTTRATCANSRSVWCATRNGRCAPGAKALVIFEGRDGAGKDGTIKRITEHLAPRNTRVVALPKPSDRQTTQWYFQRYVAHLPAAGEFVLFNRSWYNRAGVEPVMGFCTPRETRGLPARRARLRADAGGGRHPAGQDLARHLQERTGQEARRAADDPLKQLKVSDLDGVAQKKWKAYSEARDEMLGRTHTPIAPWTCVRADHKKTARLNVIRHLLHTLAPPEVTAKIEAPDPKILFPFEEAALKDGRLAK